jgi:DNA/RNA endonuclease YhcR with UshA esterase domain
MKRWAIPLVALGTFLMHGTALQAHHALAGIYDLNETVVLEGVLTRLNFRNPHSNIEIAVPDEDGTITDWVLVTASTQVLTRQGVDRSVIRPGDPLRLTILPARNGSPMGFIRSLELGDREILLYFEDGPN